MNFVSSSRSPSCSVTPLTLAPRAVDVSSRPWAGGIGAALAIGAPAGLLPALRAARLSPTQALWSL